MKYHKQIAFIFLFLTSTTCFAQKSNDKWFKRNWHNMMARFNTYYHAQDKLNIALDQLANKHVDDFETLIPIYPYGTEADALAMREPMEVVMKKASKVIQSRPRSKWVDDSYLIIGKTHFFKNDIPAANEAFQFVYSQYKNRDIQIQSQLWLLKSYIKENKLEDAEALLEIIREQVKKTTLSHKVLEEIYLTGGDLLIRQKNFKDGIELLLKGLSLTKNRTLKYRTNFLLGQVYMKNEDFENASKHFEKVMKLNAPYEYVFQANLGLTLAAAQGGNEKNKKTAKKYLKRMLDDDKNIDYYDQIYFELARIEFDNGNKEDGLEYLIKSAQNTKQNTKQSTKTYLFLADYYFNNKVYNQAQLYYDSTVAVMPEDYPNKDFISAKHIVLSKLIDNLKLIDEQDSLLKLAALPKDQLDKNIKQKATQIAEQKRKQAEDAEAQRQQDLLNQRNRTTNTTINNTGEWYFYNTQALAQGYNDFLKQWGNRRLEEWWRFLNVSASSITTSKNTTKENPEEEKTYDAAKDDKLKEILKDIDVDLLTYYKNIPLTPLAQLSANRKIETAHFEVGKIYFEDLKEYKSTNQYLSTLLRRYPQTSYEEEALYYLSKANHGLQNSSQSSAYLNNLKDKYPKSIFLEVISMSENTQSSTVSAVSDTLELLYEQMYQAYEQRNFEKYNSLKTELTLRHTGNSLQAKFDFLHAQVIGATKGKEAYISELKAIAENYPNDEYGKKASQDIQWLSADKSENKNSIFNLKTIGEHYFVISGNALNPSTIEMQLADYNSEFFPDEKFEIKTIEFNDKQLFYIKPFATDSKVKKYYRDMKTGIKLIEKAGLENTQIYPITIENFKLLMKNKEEKIYISLFSDKY